MVSRVPRHEQSLPAFAFDKLALPSDLADIPASTRTSYTRVEMSRPVTSAGPSADPAEDGVDADQGNTLSSHPRPHTVDAAGAAGRFVRADDDVHDMAPDSEHNSHVAEAGITPEVPQTPHASVTFLLVSGRRRTMLFEPATTVGRVKELVWNAWPADWQDERPPAPSYLRILHLGKVLQDEDTLAHLNFAVHTPPVASPPSTIVHLSIRSTPPPAEDSSKKKKGWGRNGEDDGADGAGCACCIIC